MTYKNRKNTQKRSRKPNKFKTQNNRTPQPAPSQVSRVRGGEINWGHIGFALMVWGFISFFVAAYFSYAAKTDNYRIVMQGKTKVALANATSDRQPPNQIGPIVVDKRGETYEIVSNVSVPTNRWNFIEIEVLDMNDEYLYSFGQELWHETGRDSDGFWREQRGDFETRITFPEPGFYYLNFWVQSNYETKNDRINVQLIKRNGSTVLHNWLGIILFVIGIIMVEVQYGALCKTIEVLND